MAMDAAALKSDIKTGLVSIFNDCGTGEGLPPEEYADRIAETIAAKIIKHITEKAEVTTTVTGTVMIAGAPVTMAGTGTGKVS
jgi:hypothetical protein